MLVSGSFFRVVSLIIVAMVVLLIVTSISPSLLPCVGSSVRVKHESDSTSLRVVTLINRSLRQLKIDNVQAECTCVSGPVFPVVVEPFQTHEMEFVIDKQRLQGAATEIRLLARAPHSRISVSLYP